MWHRPEPAYLYEYKPTSLQCSECGAHFNHTELQSDSFWDGDSEYFSDTICPKCGAWNCLDVLYESIDVVVREVLP